MHSTRTAQARGRGRAHRESPFHVIVRVGLALLAALALSVPFSVYGQARGDAPAGAPAGPKVQPDGSGKAAAADQASPGSLNAAVQLCERLAGSEREICLKQARENRERAADAVGATPGESGVLRAEPRAPR